MSAVPDPAEQDRGMAVVLAVLVVAAMYLLSQARPPGLVAPAPAPVASPDPDQGAKMPKRPLLPWRR